jgi:hypothetical protein
MQKHTLSLGVALSALFVPGVLLAQSVPSPVSGLQAVVQNGQVAVSWNAPSEQNVAYYRVYFSTRPILENGGAYDDFEATQNANTFYTLQYKPAAGTLYIAVLAVNLLGIEGEVFVEEAVVSIGSSSDAPAFVPTLEEYSPPAQQTPPDQVIEEGPVQLFDLAPENDPTPEEVQELQQTIQEQVDSLPTWQEVDYKGKLHLILTDVPSPTEVTLTFSGNPTVDAQRAPEAFSIVNSNGDSLRIESIFIEGDIITVSTENQTRDSMYEIKLSEPLEGRDGSPLDATNRQAFFVGHPAGEEKVQEVEIPTPQAPEQPADPRGVSDLTLTTSSLLNGTYTVHARWNVRNAYNDLVYYSIRQSNDGGETFSAPELMPFAISGLDIPSVLPGEYGVAISTINIFGAQAPEVFTSVSVGPQEPPKPPEPVVQPVSEESQVGGVEATITEEEVEVVETVRTVGSSNLSQSGAGIALGTLGTIGACAGLYRKRKHKKVL